MTVERIIFPDDAPIKGVHSEYKQKSKLMTTKTAHTPGPWKVSMPHITTEGALGYMATMSDHPEALANARLLAAAPELLAACQAFLDGDRGVSVSNNHATYKANIAKASAAIKHAEGG